MESSSEVALKGGALVFWTGVLLAASFKLPIEVESGLVGRLVGSVNELVNIVKFTKIGKFLGGLFFDGLIGIFCLLSQVFEHIKPLYYF